MKNLLARIAAAAGLTLLFGAAAFAQMAPPPAPPAPAGTAVKSHTRTLKSGKVVTVHGYTRKSAMPKMTAVKGYTRTTKSGKTVTVKGYTRKAPAKKMMMKKM